MQYKIIVDKQPSSNPSSEKKEYVIDIEELRVKGNVYDSLNIELNRTYVTRRLSLSEYGVLSVLDEPIIQELTDVDIKLFEGDNYIYLIDMQGNKFYAEYLIKNDFNDIYVNRNEMNSAITQTAENIELSVNQKLTGYATTDELEEQVTELNSTITQTASEINLEVSKKVGDDEIISKINQSAEKIQINANKISLEGKEINLTSDNISITSESLSIDENGNIEINGFDGENDSSITLNSKNSNRDLNINPSRILFKNNEDGREMFLYNIPNGTWFVMRAGTHEISILNDGDSFTQMDFKDGINTTTIRPSEIITPKLTQTSLESIKKNISKFDKNATDIINNSDIYEYNLKSDSNEDKKLIGFVIGDNYKTPSEVIDKNGQAVSLYSAIGILWKAVQELSARVEQLEKEVQHE